MPRSSFYYLYAGVVLLLCYPHSTPTVSRFFLFHQSYQAPYVLKIWTWTNTTTRTIYVVAHRILSIFISICSQDGSWNPASSETKFMLSIIVLGVCDYAFAMRLNWTRIGSFTLHQQWVHESSDAVRGDPSWKKPCSFWAMDSRKGCFRVPDSEKRPRKSPGWEKPQLMCDG